MIRQFSIRFVACLLGIALPLTANDLLAGQPEATSTVARCLSREWLLLATGQIRTTNRLILYRGTSDGVYSADGQNWTGRVEGEVLVLDDHVAQSGASVQLRPDNTVRVDNPASIVHDGAGLSEAQTVIWRKLLANISVSSVSDFKAHSSGTDLSPEGARGEADYDMAKHHQKIYAVPGTGKFEVGISDDMGAYVFFLPRVKQLPGGAVDPSSVKGTAYAEAYNQEIIKKIVEAHQKLDKAMEDIHSGLHDRAKAQGN